MQNINQEITHSLYFLSNCRMNLQAMIKLISEYTNIIDRISIDDPSFGGHVRDEVKKFYKKYNLEEEKIIHGYKLFMQEMTDIISNKSDEKVIYNIEKFRTSLLWFIQFKKLLKKTKSPLMMKKDTPDMKSDYVKLIAYKKLESAFIREYTMVERIMNRLITLTGMDPESLNI